MSESAAATCNGKQGYDSPALAQKIAKRRKRIAVRVTYKCKECGKWHLGSSLYRDRVKMNKFKAKKYEFDEA
jgi:ribosomal protein L44E